MSKKVHYFMINSAEKERVCWRGKDNDNDILTHMVSGVTCRHCLIYMEAGKADVDFNSKQKRIITTRLGNKGFGHGHRSRS